MANKYKGEHTVVMNGKDYVLKYDLNSMAEIQERMGVDSMDGVLRKFEAMEFKTIRLMLWAGILHNHLDEHERPTVTEREVGTWDMKLMDCATVIGEALQRAMGLEKEEIDRLEAEQKAQELAQKKAVASKAKATKKKT